MIDGVLCLRIPAASMAKVNADETELQYAEKCEEAGLLTPLSDAMLDAVPVKVWRWNLETSATVRTHDSEAPQLSVDGTGRSLLHPGRS
jgi:hypothetical protein